MKFVQIFKHIFTNITLGRYIKCPNCILLPLYECILIVFFFLFYDFKVILNGEYCSISCD